MTDRLPPLNALRAFEAAARLRSVKKAAEELFVTPAAVSHQVRQLEEFLGVSLFERLPRGIRLTDRAEAMLPGVREGFDALMAAVGQVRQVAAGAARLYVSAPPNFAARWLVPRLANFAQAHPEVEIHLASRSRMIDSAEAELSRGPGEAAAESASVSIRFGVGRYSGTRVDRLFEAAYVPVCSPRFLKGKHALRKPADLRHYTLLHDDTVPDGATRPTWEDWLANAGVEGVDGAKGPHFSNASLSLGAAIDGMGVALALKPLLAAEIEAGRLAIPFDIAAPTRFSYFLVAAKGIADRPAVAAFREWLLAQARAASAPRRVPAPRARH